MKLPILSVTKRRVAYRASVGLFAFLGVCFLWGSVHPVQAQLKGGRLITVHDRGTESTFVSTKPTLREAFADKNITVDSHDAVEPGLDEQLVATDYQVNIYRARPVVVIDGATRTKIVTPYQSAERIVRDAKIELLSGDTTSLRRSADIVGDGAALQLTITRATPINVDLYGAATTIRTQTKTVADLLKEKKITLGASDRVSVDTATPITANMSLRIWREGKQTITATESLAFATKQISDADRPSGYREVQTAGKEGQRTVTYELTIQNGVEVSRTEIAALTTSEPITQVVVVGTKVVLPAGSHTDWMAAAGISAEDYGYVDYIVSRESGWSPTKWNYGGSGAYGLCQALPATKMASAGGDYMTNPITQLKWCNGYAVGRYGSWEGAYSFWVSHKWW